MRNAKLRCMKLNKAVPLFAALCLMVGLSGCGNAGAVGAVDAVSSASQLYYGESSLNHDKLLEAIANEEGACTIATVNADGSPNLIVSVPGVADEDHLMFGWADNVTKENILRDKQAVIAYYIYHKDSEQKTERHQGARVICTLEDDEATVKKLVDSTGVGHATFLKITEILPIG